jgi:hypothetical protein
MRTAGRLRIEKWKLMPAAGDKPWKNHFGTGEKRQQALIKVTEDLK